MVWLAITFDGEGLAFARMTRHDRQATAHMRIGAPIGDEPRYPTATRLRATRIDADDVQAMLERHYGGGEARADGDDVVATCLMPASRLWADRLQALLPLRNQARDLHASFAGGSITLFVQPDDAQALASRIRMASGAEVHVLSTLDLSPWRGLDDLL